nr:immunoglobulin heavy chain junction region [Mus musculus]MBK4198043.1 immunoglobulin heavy chain junction region [Mus musculus]
CARNDYDGLYFDYW